MIMCIQNLVKFCPSILKILPWKPEFWSDLTQNQMQPFPQPNAASDKICCDQPIGFRDIHVWKCEHTDVRMHARTDAGSTGIL